uniref:Uncharacterized protein n=1 Tax=Anguilla anguilla TaxID=7936 RepID=A0A0E9QHK6_ANGAN
MQSRPFVLCGWIKHDLIFFPAEYEVLLCVSSASGKWHYIFTPHQCQPNFV